MASPLDDLLSRRVVILSGKGGVGKSVVGSAIASAAAARGKKTLYVEIDTPLDAARCLGGRAVAPARRSSAPASSP